MRFRIALAVLVAVCDLAVAQDASRTLSITGNDRARASAAGVVVELRSDFGFARLAQIEFTNGRRVSLDSNEGSTLALGASFLPLGGGRLATRATAGVKVQLLRASNGGATFMAFPVELVEVGYAGPLRLGLGGSVLLSPRLRGSGFLESQTRTYRPAPGAVAEAEWIVSPRTRTGIGVRGSWTWLSGDGVSASGPSIGLVLRADFDVAR